jgi:hypothetical protein
MSIQAGPLPRQPSTVPPAPTFHGARAADESTFGRIGFSAGMPSCPAVCESSAARHAGQPGQAIRAFPANLGGVMEAID